MKDNSIISFLCIITVISYFTPKLGLLSLLAFIALLTCISFKLIKKLPFQDFDVIVLLGILTLVAFIFSVIFSTEYFSSSFNEKERLIIFSVSGVCCSISFLTLLVVSAITLEEKETVMKYSLPLYISKRKILPV